jgi:hypothetical protein
MLKILREFTRHTLFNIVVGISVLVFIGAFPVTFFESGANDQFAARGDAIWWALVTMATVLTKRLAKANCDLLKLTTAFSLALEGA